MTATAKTLFAGAVGLVLLAGTAGAEVFPPDPSWPVVGRFDEHGRYHPPGRRRRFSELYQEDRIPHYPVVLVHGQGGFDRLRILKFVYGDYFNGVARTLRKAGITVHSPVTPPFGKIAERAVLLKEQILAYGHEKVNLICHSMGGLDARYMVTHLGMADRVASITTVGTPHHGSWYADFAIEWIMEKQKFWKVWEWMGLSKDSIPQLTVKFLNQEFNPQTPNMPQVRYFSLGGNQGYFGTILPFKGAKLIMAIIEKRAVGRKLSFTQRMLEKVVLPREARARWAGGPAAFAASTGLDASWVPYEVAGQNDCQVSVASAMWGEYLGTLDADHFDQPGWFGLFRQERFYRELTRMLADAGL